MAGIGVMIGSKQGTWFQSLFFTMELEEWPPSTEKAQFSNAYCSV